MNRQVINGLGDLLAQVFPPRQIDRDPFNITGLLFNQGELSIRPERINIVNEYLEHKNCVPAVVSDNIYKGQCMDLWLTPLMAPDSQKIRMTTYSNMDIKIGERINCVLPPNDLVALH